MDDKQAQPWWTFGHVWLVISGPAVVVVASLVTLYLAITIPDPVDTSYNTREQAMRHVDPITGSGVGTAPNQAPAMQARNHAATGVLVPSKP